MWRRGFEEGLFLADPIQLRGCNVTILDLGKLCHIGMLHMLLLLVFAGPDLHQKQLIRILNGAEVIVTQAAVLLLDFALQPSRSDFV